MSESDQKSAPVKELREQIDRLQAGILRIMRGIQAGTVGGDDVVWFDEYTTLYDFCDGLLHPDDSAEMFPEMAPIHELVTRFSAALTGKLVASEIKHGWKNGWMRDDWRKELIDQLLKHIEKGDPRDVAAYCAFAWHHGWTISPTSERGSPENTSGGFPQTKTE